MTMHIHMDEIIDELRKDRPIFCSEDDFKFEMASLLRKKYPDIDILLEYTPELNKKMHIDIMVISPDGWIPIELKYKTAEYSKKIGCVNYNLTDQSARDQGAYRYLHDIERTETIKEKEPDLFQEGYAVMITNDRGYIEEPHKKDCYSAQFCINEGVEKTGIMKWDDKAADGTKGDCEKPIELQGTYRMHWKDYSRLDDSRNGKFYYIVNCIE